MRVSVTEAKARLAELVRRAEAGEEVALTRHGHAVARLVAMEPAQDRECRGALLEAVRTAGAAKATAGLSAARSQDFLYDVDGLLGCAAGSSQLMAAVLRAAGVTLMLSA